MPSQKKKIDKDALAPNEWKTLQIVWELKSCAGRDVSAVAAERFGWAPTTTKTYLALLVEKERIRAKRVGNSFLYQPKGSIMTSLRQAADGLMEKTLSGTEVPLLSYLIKNSALSDKDLAELRGVLDAELEEQKKRGGDQ